MLCPGCGSGRPVSNHIDERPLAEAARRAPELRHFGYVEAAASLLGALYAVRTANFRLLRWRCECGVTFDD